MTLSVEDRLQVGFAVLLIGGILAGLFVRRRAGACWSFVAYLVAVAASDALAALWPQRFWRHDFWVFKESVHSLLKLAIVVELMVRIFQPFPSAYAAARRAVLALLLGLGALVAVSLTKGTEYLSVVGRLYPHLNDGTVWLFIALGGYCLWYHLPLDSLHKAILVALVPYLLVYSVVLRALVAVGWERGDVFNASAPIAYLFVLFYWLYAAWRRGDGDSGRRVSDLISKGRR